MYFKGYIHKIGITLQFSSCAPWISGWLSSHSCLVNWIEFAQHRRKAWEQRLNYIPKCIQSCFDCCVTWTEHTGTSILRLVLYSQTISRCAQYACAFSSNETIRERNRPIELCVWEIQHLVGMCTAAAGLNVKIQDCSVFASFVIIIFLEYALWLFSNPCELYGFRYFICRATHKHRIWCAIIVLESRFGFMLSAKCSYLILLQ